MEIKTVTTVVESKSAGGGILEAIFNVIILIGAASFMTGGAVFLLWSF